MKYTIKGTTFSGHPTRTTFGNTMRVLLYAGFVAHKANIPVDFTKKRQRGLIEFFVSGDDAMVKLSKDADLENFS
jgi:hypothetical protein